MCIRDRPKLDEVWHDSTEFPFFDAGNIYELNEQAARAGEQVMAKPGKLAKPGQAESPVQENLFEDVVLDSSLSLQFHNGKHWALLPDDGSEDEF